MPNKDGTGPRGNGPLTGRRMGNCEGADNLDVGRPGRRLFRRRMSRN